MSGSRVVLFLKFSFGFKDRDLEKDMDRKTYSLVNTVYVPSSLEIGEA